jgi:uncharacterized membrane protein YfcA
MSRISSLVARTTPAIWWVALLLFSVLAMTSVLRNVRPLANVDLGVILPHAWLLLFAAGILGGALNAVAGGGSFVTLPALLSAGILPVHANAMSTVALWPGAWASVAAYRREISSLERKFLLVLVGTSLVGGVAGAQLLLNTPQETFMRLTPYLLLGATLLLIVGRKLARLLQRWTPRPGEAASTRTLVGLGVAQFVFAMYGGYFGGGLGVLLLATLLLMGIESIHQMNGLKALLTTAIRGVAVLVFVLAGVIAWPETIIMIGGSIVGGYGGAEIARRADPRLVKGFTVVVGLVMTIYFFVR